MLSVYVSLFGTQALGFRKPLVLLLTSLSVGIGYVWLRREIAKSGDMCAGSAEQCPPENAEA
jgi:hypothetical protein